MSTNNNVLFVLKFLIIGFVCILWLPAYGFALQDNYSEFPIRSNGPIIFDLDLCQFDGVGDSTRIEIFYSVYLTKPDSTNIAGNNSTTLEIFLKILNDSGKVLDQIQEEKTISFSDSLPSGQNSTFIDLKSFNLFPDSVTLELIIQDKITGRTGQVFMPMNIRNFDNQFSLSDLYFVSHIQKATGKSVFERRGIMMVPHPSRTFFISDDSQKAFIFYEINNLRYNPSKQSFYDATATVFDIRGEEVFKNVKELIKVGSTNSSRIDVLPIGTLNSGIYRILVQVLDRDAGIRQEITSHFKILTEDTDKTDILPMSDEEAEKYYDQIKYIATSQELDIFDQLDPKGKQEFLLQFWKSRDSNPRTAENEFMLEHFRRIAFVDQNFKGGLNSDMGRVYIKYGQPYEIERNASRALSSQEIEVWIYGVQGRTEFIFVDRIGDKKFNLVHSTHLDEFSNPAWQQDL